MTEQQTKGRTPAFWPVILTGLIAAAALICLWALWQDNSAEINAVAEQTARVDSLVRERDALKALLALPPCETAKKLKSQVPEETPAQKTSSISPSGNLKADAIEQACVFVVSTDGKSQLSTGSGFFVAPGYVVTNKHVVSNGYPLVTNRTLGKPAAARIVAQSSDSSSDFALLRVNMPHDAHITPLPLAREIRKTEKVGSWGYPHLIGKADPGYAKLLRGEDLSSVPELTYTEGVISAVLPRNPQVIVHTAPISPGNSGGPLLNEKGEVVGINTMISLDEDSYRQASLALAAPDLLKFLQAQGILK